jgi:hypothetical protein
METPRERQLREKEKQEFVASLKLREAYRATFNTESGLLVLRDIIERGHMLETTCSGNAWSYFYEGERNFVLRIGAMIPDLLGLVMQWIMASRQEEVNAQMAEIMKERPSEIEE